MTNEELDRIKRAEEIQRYTENRCEALEKENAELIEQIKMLEQGYVYHDYDAGEDCYEDSHEGRWVKRDEIVKLTEAKEIIKNLLDDLIAIDGEQVRELDTVKEAELFSCTEDEATEVSKY